MKLPRISISFSDRTSDGAGQPSGRSAVLSPRVLSIDPQEVAARVAAIAATCKDTALTEEDMAAARRQVASIRLAWQDFQSNLEDDRMVLQAARRIQLLEVLEELQQRHDSAATHLEPLLQPTLTPEVLA